MAFFLIIKYKLNCIKSWSALIFNADKHPPSPFTIVWDPPFPPNLSETVPVAVINCNESIPVPDLTITDIIQSSNNNGPFDGKQGRR